MIQQLTFFPCVCHRQTICRPVGPKCDECSLASKGLCKRVGLGRMPKSLKKKNDDEAEDEDASDES
jgi:adenine-specific DNA glycosylase